MLESPDYAWCSAESEIVWTRSNDCSLTNPSYLWAWMVSALGRPHL